MLNNKYVCLLILVLYYKMCILSTLKLLHRVLKMRIYTAHHVSNLKSDIFMTYDIGIYDFTK